MLFTSLITKRIDPYHYCIENRKLFLYIHNEIISTVLNSIAEEE